MSEHLMDGFPPRAETQVTLANWRTTPFNRWAFQHVREILPTADISHDPTRERQLTLKLAAFDRLRITGANGKALTLDQALEATSTDGLVVLHRLDRAGTLLQRHGAAFPAHPHVRL